MLTENEKTNALMRALSAKMDFKSFKIGKTGEVLNDRLNQPDYRDKYTSIVELYRSPFAEKVSEMEAYLIDANYSLPNCDNTKDGDASINDPMAEANMYFVYMVGR